ncbi:helix-turn-helix domain-containing protein [Peptococcus simiae]|uniref:helix-turn-helix domain-containing protein n=1 Tax=Peptococcus simiae TaxID=1643805 RepID=UPI00397ED1FE
MVDLVLVGRNLKVLREEANLTQAQVAGVLSVDQSLVARIESGERSVSTEMLDKLAALYCCPSEDILAGVINSKKINIAYRKNALSISDLEKLAVVHRIILNQLEMDKIAGGK